MPTSPLDPSGEPLAQPPADSDASSDINDAENAPDAHEAQTADTTPHYTVPREHFDRLIAREERYRHLFNSVDVAFCIIAVQFDDQNVPYDYLFVETNPAFEQHTGLVNAVGRTIRELVPTIDESWFPIYGKVALTGEPVRFENHDAALRRWFDAYALRVGPAADHTVGILFTDITPRKEAQEALRRAEERERARLTDIFMRAPAFMAALRGPEHTFDLVNEPYYRLIGRDDSDSIVGRTVAEVLPEVAEQGFIALLDQVYQTGEPYSGTNMRVLLHSQSAGDAADPAALPTTERFIDFTYLPLFDEQRSVSGILVHGVDLTERKKLEDERTRLIEEQQKLLAEARARADRDALLNRIAAAVRSSLDPDEILQAAVSTLGQGMGVDRCYFIRYEDRNDTTRIFCEWRREGVGLEPLLGRTFRSSSFELDREPALREGRTHVVNDICSYPLAEAESLLGVQVRSLIRVPIMSDEHLTCLAVVRAFSSHEWSADEVRLIENVGSLIRSSLENAQLQARERNIARRLQDALQPPAPENTHGLSIASFYRPALAEANVGGDFFDVFPVVRAADPESSATAPRETGSLTALVVADLSGKGLAAASQVSAVRNMLRYALYSHQSVAVAATGLHRALVRHDLLSGFSTLFVGIYDAHRQTLTYVNCGQEPGLIWRAACGQVEQLPPTGPVLGGFGGGDFEERTVYLNDRDVIALFTDGLTEVGPSRKSLLEVEGVSEVLRDCCGTTAPDAMHPNHVVDCLISGIHNFARGHLRDDIALLVAIVTAP